MRGAAVGINCANVVLIFPSFFTIEKSIFTQAMNAHKQPLEYALFQGTEGQLSYFYSRSGENLLLFFPGYGQTHQHYQDWVEHLPKDWSFLMINHFGFCESAWESKPQSNRLWAEAVKKLVDEVHGKPKNLGIGAFSLGNWLAAKLIQSKLFKPNCWVVFASPGNGFSRLVWVSNTLFPLKQLFAWFCKNPKQLIGSAALIAKLGLIPLQRVRLLELQLGSIDQAKQVYQNWKNMVHFIPNWQKVVEGLNEKEPDILFLYGSSDKITPGKKLTTYFKQKATIVEFKGAHSHKNQEAFGRIVHFLNKKREQ